MMQPDLPPDPCDPALAVAFDFFAEMFGELAGMVQRVAASLDRIESVLVADQGTNTPES